MVITVDRGENIDGVWKGCEYDMNALVKSVTECWKNIIIVIHECFGVRENLIFMTNSNFCLVVSFVNHSFSSE